MYNKQLKVNIEQLDLRIAKLNKNIEEMDGKHSYENKMNTLNDFITLRGQLVKIYGDEPSAVIIELDEQIEGLSVELKNYEREDTYQTTLQQLENLTKVRCQLAESRIKGSHASTLISGLLGISAILLVLHYEKTDVVTSKAFGMIGNIFRGI